MGPVLCLFFRQSTLHRATFSLWHVWCQLPGKGLKCWTPCCTSFSCSPLLLPVSSFITVFAEFFFCSSPMHLELAVKCGLFSMFSIKSCMWQVIYQQDYRLEYCGNWTPRCHNSLENASHGRFYLPEAVHY